MAHAAYQSYTLSRFQMPETGKDSLRSLTFTLRIRNVDKAIAIMQKYDSEEYAKRFAKRIIRRSWNEAE